MKEKILIIEDDTEVLANLKILLEEEGYDVKTAPDGAEGIKQAKTETPDLIICDVLMPKMTGYEVIKTLSILEETETIPFLFLTAKTDVNDIREGLKLGADDYLLKPYDADELLEAVKLRIKKYAKLKTETEVQPDTSEEKKKYKEDDRIFLNINGKPQFVKITSIICILAERQYINIHFDDGYKLMMRKSLNHWESILPESVFARIHRSSIINLNAITKVEKWFQNSYRIHLGENIEPVIMSKRYASKLKSKL